MEELKLNYELKTYKRRADKLAPSELKKVHPLGKSPVLTIEAPGAEKPLVLAESAAIVEYLCDHFGSAQPSLVPERYQAGRENQVGGEREEWIRYRYFMHYVEGTLMPYLVMALVNDSTYPSLPSFRREHSECPDKLVKRRGRVLTIYTQPFETRRLSSFAPSRDSLRRKWKLRS